MNPIIRWWVTPYLPKNHIFLEEGKKPKGRIALFQIYFKKWIVHPIKRRLAKGYLILIRAIFHTKVIGITGSAGKTTTKDMLTSILKKSGRVISSYKNIDPIYNIPDTILKISPRTKYLVLEMGVEFPGEMDYYLWLAKPDIGLITNIFPTHTEFFKSTKGVFEEKSKLLHVLTNLDTAILNYENPSLKNIVNQLQVKTILYGKGSDIFANKILLGDNFITNFQLNLRDKKIDIHLPIVGEQFVENALASTAVAYSLGVDTGSIKEGLECYVTPEHRMKIIHLKNGAVLLDDSYNSNPEAAKRTISTFNKIAKRKTKIIVFGDMLELGTKEKKYHRNLGNYILKKGVDYLIGVGLLSKETVRIVGEKIGKNKVFWFADNNGVAEVIEKIMDKNTLILVKGSRGIGLDKVVNKLS